MSSPPTIYVDLDDVLAETGRTFLGVLSTEFGHEVRWEEVHDYDLGVSLGLDKARLAEFMHAVHRPDVLRSIVPVEGAREALADWSAQGYVIEIVTGRPRATEEVSREWLTANRIPHDSLLFVDKYAWEEELHGTSTGVPLVELSGNGYCLAIEDSAEVSMHLTDILDAPVAVLDRPWNRRALGEHSDPDGRIIRCNDWQEIVDRFPSP